MKNLVFDAGPIISLGLSRLLWTIEGLKKEFNGKFLITRYVHNELVTIPLKSKKFKLEAYQVEELVRMGVLNIVEKEDIFEHTRKLMDIANSMYTANGRPLNIVQVGEISSLALACNLGSLAVVVDETATRQILEDPPALARRLSHKLGTNVQLDASKFKEWRRSLCDLKVIRSVELATIAFEQGLLNRYVPSGSFPGVRDARTDLYEAVLWSIKLAGCSVSEKEIHRLLTIHK